MDKTTRRLTEIAGHLDAITEGMQENKIAVMEGTILRFYAEDIKALADDIRGLLRSGGR